MSEQLCAPLTPDGLAHGLLRRLPELAGKKVLVIGDSMVDRYLVGQVERISPEAPVPVVKVVEEWHRLGGAGNVARNIAALGGVPLLVSVVGRDASAGILAGLLEDAGIRHLLAETPGRPTTLKTRVLAGNQQVCRVDQEDGGPLDAAALDAVFAQVATAHAEGAEVAVVSDYGKGMVGPGFMERLRAAMPGLRFVAVDPVPANYDCYAGADIITPNAKEAAAGADNGGALKASGRDGVLRVGLKLFRRLRLQHVLITLGAEGMALFENPSRVRHVPTFAQKVFDVTGAGDTVIAVLALATAAGLPLLEACVLANYAAGVVVGQVGTAAVTPAELAQAIEHQPEPVVADWL